MICVNFTINEMGQFEIIGYSNNPTTEIGIIFRNSLKINDNESDVEIQLFTRIELEKHFINKARQEIDNLVKQSKDLLNTIESHQLELLLK